MGPRLVQHPVIRPHRCALLPIMSASNERGGFADFGTDLDLDHVYVSFTAFQQMAQLWGFVPARSLHLETARMGRELDEARERTAEAERKLAAAEKQLEAVETLRRGGFETARKPGRPKKAAKPEPAGVA